MTWLKPCARFAINGRRNEMATLKDRCIWLLLRFSWMARRNPVRFLFNDSAFNAITGNDDDVEAQFLKRRWVQNGSGKIWDVGASLGKYTCDIARANPNCRVYAFEPNFNSLYFLAYRTARFSNVEIVPSALTADGRDFKGTYDPNFTVEPTGPLMPTFSLPEAIAKFGKPDFIKLDVEGEEYRIFREHAELLRGVHVFVEWHTYYVKDPIPPLKHWRVTDVCPGHTYLEPISEK